MTRACAVVLALVVSSLPLASAAAQEPAPEDAARLLDDASTAIDDARFVDADVSLDQATRTTFARPELLRWLGLRALLSYADGRLGALEEALAGFASLAPTDGELPSAFPSPLRARLTELRALGESITLRATPAVSLEGGGRELSLPVEATDDPGHLVRSIEVWAAIDDGAEALLAPGETRRIEGDVHRDFELRYRLIAHGPGGAAVATAGSLGAPLTLRVPGAPRSGLDDGWIAAIVTASVVVLAGAIVLGWGASENWWRGTATSVIGP